MTPHERSRKALEGVNVRRLLEESNLPVEIATAIADRLEYVSSEGWQPIGTAPKDETTVLLSVPTLYGKWNKTIAVAGRWEARDHGNGFWTIFNADEAIQRVDPPHWMPSPAQPIDSSLPAKEE